MDPDHGPVVSSSTWPELSRSLHRIGQSSAAFYVVLLLLNSLTRPYMGIVHDARFYAVQVLNRIDPLRYSGDLYLKITVRPHAKFERHGDNLHVSVPVPLATAVLGGEVQVPTPKGNKLALKIPPETQNGRSFRLKGQGMPHLGKSERGDIVAKVNVVLPTELSEKEKDLFRQLNEIRPA